LTNDDYVQSNEHWVEHNMVEFVSPQGVEQSVMDCEGTMLCEVIGLKPSTYLVCHVMGHIGMPGGYSGSFRIT
jgi:hypothetical protein